MPKFLVYSPDDNINLLEKAAFGEDHQMGNHKVFYNSENKKRVIVLYHKKALPIETSRSILKLAGIL